MVRPAASASCHATVRQCAVARVGCGARAQPKLERRIKTSPSLTRLAVGSYFDVCCAVACQWEGQTPFVQTQDASAGLHVFQIRADT